MLTFSWFLHQLETTIFREIFVSFVIKSITLLLIILIICQETFVSTKLSLKILMTRTRKTLNHLRNAYDDKLIISYFSFNQDSFVKQSFVIDCKLISFFRQLHVKVLLNIDIINYSFRNENIAHIACKEFKLKFIFLLKFWFLKNFDDKSITFIIYVIYSFFIVQNHCEALTLMLITKLNNHHLILSKF